MGAETVEKALRRGLWRGALRTWLLGAAVLVPILAVLLLIGTLLPYQEQRDLEGVPNQQTIGVIRMVVHHPGTKAVPPNWQGTLSVQGHLPWFTATWPMQRGDRVAVGYRIGRSGRVYVESLKPAKEEPAQQH